MRASDSTTSRPRCVLVGRRAALDAAGGFTSPRGRIVDRIELGEDDAAPPRTTELSAALRLDAIEEVWFAAPPLDGDLVRAVLLACAGRRLVFRVLDSAGLEGAPGPEGDRLRRPTTDDLVRHAREPVERSRFDGRVVLVTGAAGSIGSQISSRVARERPDRLVLFDLDANGLYRTARRLERLPTGLTLRTEVGDIRDEARVREIVARHRPQDLFHAAALKQVPLLENAPGEAVKTNVLGTRVAAESALDAGVERFVFVSTDKAVLPRGVMGATKRIGETLIRTFVGQGDTSFTIVRFGNVIGTSGSVVPIFEDQIDGGGPLTVTDAAVRRYFMTVSEATDLVLGAAEAPTGTVRVLEMGPAIPVRELAECMIVLAGARPQTDIAIRYTGLRSGEKLSEQLWTDEEAREARRVDDRVLEFAAPLAPRSFVADVKALVDAARSEDDSRVRDLLSEWLVGVNSRGARDRGRSAGHARRPPTGAGPSPRSKTPCE